jgi:hypothetical protein
VDSGRVTLHRVTPDTAGELDSVSVGADGGFRFELPSVPDPGGRGDVYFASMRYRDVLYFGDAVHRASQLDSVYRIEVYDTVTAGAGGEAFPVAVRNLFLEEESEEGPWQVVDLIRIRNPGERTVVAPEGGTVWTYPLPPSATDFEAGESDLVPGAVAFKDGSVTSSAPIPPGERTYLVRYRIPELDFRLPLPGSTERLELLVREPAPPISATGLTRGESVELEPGSSYRRYAAARVENRVVEVSPADPGSGVDVRWIAVALALVLAVAGVLAVRWERNGRSVVGDGEPPGAAPAGSAERKRLLLRIAELDAEFQEANGPGAEAPERYREERDRLLRRLRSLD